MRSKKDYLSPIAVLIPIDAEDILTASDEGLEVGTDPEGDWGNLQPPR